jgi:hypothetical protein
MSEARPNCYFCEHRRSLVGDCHSRCVNLGASVTAKAHGVNHGWFAWPWNFDPVWLLTCDGFSELPTREQVEAAESGDYEPMPEELPGAEDAGIIPPHNARRNA